MEKKIQSRDELSSIARELLVACTPGEQASVIALSGDLGAGKTAFVKELGKILGVREEITSPTFVIMKSYEITTDPFYTTLTHIDAYRIEDEDEMRVLRFEEILDDPKRLVCIEWPEKIRNCIPKNAHSVSLTLNVDGSRILRY